jgi:uncharacterized secreted protein with C-terminal beta-propeller domain
MIGLYAKKTITEIRELRAVFLLDEKKQVTGKLLGLTKSKVATK